MPSHHFRHALWCGALRCVRHCLSTTIPGTYDKLPLEQLLLPKNRRAHSKKVLSYNVWNRVSGAELNFFSMCLRGNVKLLHTEMNDEKIERSEVDDSESIGSPTVIEDENSGNSGKVLVKALPHARLSDDGVAGYQKDSDSSCIEDAVDGVCKQGDECPLSAAPQRKYVSSTSITKGIDRVSEEGKKVLVEMAVHTSNKFPVEEHEVLQPMSETFDGNAGKKQKDGTASCCAEAAEEVRKDREEFVTIIDGRQKVQKSASELGVSAKEHKSSSGVFQVQSSILEERQKRKKSASEQAMALLRAALDDADEGDGTVLEEFQRSLRVGIVGAPNAGKSLLTNQLVGTRVSAVSRKTNTTHREHLGVYTQGDTQLLYYDTPGLHLNIEGAPLRVDSLHRVENAWQIVEFCEALVVLVDAERQIRRPDMRVKRLAEKLGTEQVASQKRILCLNKVDIIEQKRNLLPLAKEFEDMLGYDRIFMISGLTGSGVKDVKDYLLNQAVLRPWDEDPEMRNHRDVALEIVREQIFEHMHEELPHSTKQQLVSWKVLKDGSIRIQQLLLVAKKEHQKILVGKNGSVIGDIGIKARKELQTILGVDVHLVLDVKLITGSE